MFLLGAGSIINPGVIIGPNVKVYAGSIVTKNYSNCVIAGVPAKHLIKK
jgi:acetyltransferase-like isoleucine patch superfamily enzyme